MYSPEFHSDLLLDCQEIN